jgi:hypothetical protein
MRLAVAGASPQKVAFPRSRLDGENAHIDPTSITVTIPVGDRDGSHGWRLRDGVADLQRERARLIGLGVSAEEVETVPGVISFFDFSDPDGNGLSCYQVSPA